MPKIKIYESDLTTAGGLNASSNVVYIPGFAKHINSKYATGGKYEITFPHQFNSVDEFKEVFSNEDGKFEYITLKEEIDGKTYNVKVERSMQYALAVLQAGLPILYDFISTVEDNSSEEDVLIPLISNKINSDRLNKLVDKNNYDVKFITTGGYANYGGSGGSINLGQIMLDVAAARGDCTALIDHPENLGFETVSKLFETSNLVNGKFGAMFTPWCTFEFPTYQVFDIPDNGIRKLAPINMPGSLAYLLAFGTSVSNNNANWLAAAGAARGIIPNLVAPLENLTEAQIDEYSLANATKNYIGVAINPIAKINPYGTIVWGNRTLHKGTVGLVASSFLNIRQLCNDIKKTLYVACKSITFEQNSDILWVKFKSLITPLLDRMQTGDGIAGYELKKKKTSKKATLCAVIRIYPVEAVEDFDLTLELADEATSITE